MLSQNSNHHHHQRAFTHNNSFHLFLYSYTPDKKPLFLLSKSSSSPEAFTNFPGHYTKDHPNLYFSICREFLTHTKGLLDTRFLKHFQAENPEPYTDESIVLEKGICIAVRPEKGVTAGMDDILKKLCECDHIFQDSKGDVSYFIEYPHLNTELVNKVAQEKGLKINMRYYTLEEIIDSKDNTVCNELKRLLENESLRNYIHEYIVNRKPIEHTKYYAIYSCDPVVKTYMLHCLHYSVYRKPGEHWRFYKAFEDDHPTDEELRRLKGVLIPGSGRSAYQTDVPWFKGAFETINRIFHEHKHINLLGICFGHQIIAQALGGRVEKMNRSFLRGGDELQTLEEFYELDYVKGLNLDKQKPFVIGKSHGDHVVVLPPGGKVYGSSATTHVEIYTIGDNVLAMQGHPEFNEPWTAGANYRSKKLDLEGDEYDRYVKEYIGNTFKQEISQKELLSVCYHFLKKENKK